MATQVHATAIVHKGAYLADDVQIGPYCIIEDDVQIGAFTQIESHVVVDRGSRIGKNCRIWPCCVIGGAPQDYKYRGERSYLTLGDNNLVREYVTLHRAAGEGSHTRIGSDNMFMAYSHVGHNCEIGNGNTISSYCGLSGHVSIEDNTVLGGMVGVHQFCRIGKMSMVGGMSKVNQDIPPFMLADGAPARVLELNKIGLRRHGVPPSERTALRQAYKLLFRSGFNLTQAMEQIEEEVESCDELDYLLAFMRGTQGGYGGRGNDRGRR